MNYFTPRAVSEPEFEEPCPREPQAAFFDAIVLGSGVTGLASARLLTERGCSVAVVDAYKQPGGNHISKDFGPFTFDIGSIFFHQGNVLFDMFPAAKQALPLVNSSCERICPNGGIRQHPFDVKREFLQRSPLFIARALGDLLWHKMGSTEASSAEDFVKYYLGSLLLRESGLEHYVERFYGVPLSQITSDLADRRMGWIRRNGSFRALARKKFAALLTPGGGQVWQDERQFVRPRSGFKTMYSAVQDSLEKEGVAFYLGADLQSITPQGDGFEIAGPGIRLRSRRLLSTVPLAENVRLFRLEDVEPPRSIRMATLCVRFSGERGFSAPVLYNFHASGRWKRLTMHSDFYGWVQDSEYFSLEVPLLSESETVAEGYDDFLGMIKPLGVFKGSMELLGSFETDYSYPLYERENMERAQNTLARLRAIGVETIGRQGNFDYIPSAALAISKVQKAFDLEPSS